MATASRGLKAAFTSKATARAYRKPAAGEPPMSLRSKLFAILAAVLIVYIGFHYLVQSRLIIPNLLALERSEAAADLQRCLSALRREVHHLDHFTNDWAAWDDTYAFVLNRDHGYVASNLGPQTFEDNHLACMVFLNDRGSPVWARDYNPKNGRLSAAAAAEHGSDRRAWERPHGIRKPKRPWHRRDAPRPHDAGGQADPDQRPTGAAGGHSGDGAPPDA
jgi:hypothetical protein